MTTVFIVASYTDFFFPKHTGLWHERHCFCRPLGFRRLCTNWPKIETQQIKKIYHTKPHAWFSKASVQSRAECVLGFNLAWTLHLNNTHLHNWRYWLGCRGQGLDEQCQRKCCVSALPQTSRASATLGIMGRDRQAAALRVSTFSEDHTQASSIESFISISFHWLKVIWIN